jgi:sugar-specific transcriptional regulator TrmB
MATPRTTAPEASPRRPGDGDEGIVLQLVELGLTLAQSRAYLALLAHSPEKAANVALRAGVSRTKIYEVLHALESIGFVASESDRRAIYQAVDPAIAIPQWIQTRERKRRLEREHEGRLGERLVEALPRPDATTDAEDAGEPFEPIIGQTNSSAVLPRLTRRAHSRLDLMQMPPFVQPRKEWNVAEAEALARGVRVRILNDPAALREELRVREALSLGAEMRVEAAHPLKIIIRDGEEAAIALRHAPRRKSDITTLIVRQPDLVKALTEVFDRQWQAATPVTLADLSPPADTPPADTPPAGA